MSGQARPLDTWGAIASIFGFVASICMILFTDFKVAALLSLLVAETIGLLVWWHYQRRRLCLSHPYPRECLVDYVRYEFETPTKMIYEVTEAFRVTTPVMHSVEVELTWSGRGQFSVRSDFVQGEIPYLHDGKTGKIRFTLPLPETKRFGESAVIHYVLSLEDTGNCNVPKLCKSTKRPCQLVIFEAVLRYTDTCPPAQLVWVPLGESSPFTPPNKIRDVPFDPSTHSFRTAVSNLVVGRSYQLSWTQNAKLPTA